MSQPELPEPGLISYSFDSTMRKYEHRSFTEEQMRAAIEQERAACAAEVESLAYGSPDDAEMEAWNDALSDAAEAIRARGK